MHRYVPAFHRESLQHPHRLVQMQHDLHQHQPRVYENEPEEEHEGASEAGNEDQVAEVRVDPLEDWTPSIEEIAEYSGRYFSDELETFYTVAMGEDGLLLRHRRLDDIGLVPKAKDSFNGEFPVGEINFTRDDDGALTGMMVSNWLTQNVRFDKQD